MLLTADKIHNGRRWLPQGSVIETDEQGTILAVHEQLDSDQIIHYKGVLIPGFVNAHCHLELSHMKGIIPEHTELIPFLQGVMTHRFGATDEQKKTARHEAYQELLNNGVIAVGDIVNTTDTIELRQADKLHVHSFIEAIGFTETHAQQRMDESGKVYGAFAQQKEIAHKLRQSIVPHAPYSISPALFRLIDKHQPGSTISIHNQETAAENEYYETKGGKVNDLLQGFGIDDSFFAASGKSSLHTYLPYFTAAHRYILVHNTFTKAEDVRFAQTHAGEVYWCLCPNANLYIENMLPDIPMLMQEGAAICIGTDSLSSNHELSVLSELMSIKQRYPDIQWETLISWGTLNGARALELEEYCGSIAPGKKPGIVLIDDPEINMQPKIKRIL